MLTHPSSHRAEPGPWARHGAPGGGWGGAPARGAARAASFRTCGSCRWPSSREGAGAPEGRRAVLKKFGSEQPGSRIPGAGPKDTKARVRTEPVCKPAHQLSSSGPKTETARTPGDRGPVWQMAAGPHNGTRGC